MATSASELKVFVSDIVASFVSNNRVGAGDLPRLIEGVFGALQSAGQGEDSPPADKPVPAVSIRKSLSSPEHIVSMIDGKPYRSLKRHLASRGLTFEAYKQLYDLPASYPSVAPAYSQQRSAMAIERGLGRKAAPAPAKPAKSGPAKRKK